MRKNAVILFLALLWVGSLYAQSKKEWYGLVGSAYLENESYRVLQRLCDECGGRMVGSPDNERGMEILTAELQRLGYEVKKEKFEMPGWVRGEDKVKVVSPFQRTLSAIALGYVDPTPLFTAPLVYTPNAEEKFFKENDVKGKILLIGRSRPFHARASQYGVRALLFINDRSGTLNLAKTINHTGVASNIPSYSLTYEEGEWLKRLLEKKIDVRLSLETLSYCKKIETANLVVSLPGQKREKIVVGAHFDGWDLGQGAIDNGIGSAILFDVARLLKKFHPRNEYSIEMVWFNGEEFGLWGSRKYVQTHAGEPVVAMVNMDMTGSPTGFNAMGYDHLVPFLDALLNEMDGFNLHQGVVSKPWVGSDHVPFMMQGVPCITLQAHLDPGSVSYYHSAGDTFDKVSKKGLSEASAVVSILVRELANQQKLAVQLLTQQQTMSLFKKYKLDELLKEVDFWFKK